MLMLAPSSQHLCKLASQSCWHGCSLVKVRLVRHSFLLSIGQFKYFGVIVENIKNLLKLSNGKKTTMYCVTEIAIEFSIWHNQFALDQPVM